MIVLDASAIAEYLDPGSPLHAGVAEELGSDTDWMVPEHCRLETASALRGLMLGGSLTDDEFRIAMSSLATAELTHCSTVPLLPRIAELASNATAYDAAYIALAEQLVAPIVTTDVKLSRIPATHCEVRVISRP